MSSPARLLHPEEPQAAAHRTRTREAVIEPIPSPRPDRDAGIAEFLPQSRRAAPSEPCSSSDSRRHTAVRGPPVLIGARRAELRVPRPGRVERAGRRRSGALPSRARGQGDGPSGASSGACRLAAVALCYRACCLSCRLGWLLLGALAEAPFGRVNWMFTATRIDEHPQTSSG